MHESSGMKKGMVVNIDATVAARSGEQAGGDDPGAVLALHAEQRHQGEDATLAVYLAPASLAEVEMVLAAGATAVASATVAPFRARRRTPSRQDRGPASIPSSIGREVTLCFGP